ncbi:hypothetical protein GCM10027275_50730 [Rhabdobacter roseus]|uniref:Site-specific DNA-adenine methylase n=1 Tax=Rhabdobacter roseus TaxID=1655419 RepID=A0A840TS14_9BACT|nr:hypothetical protein [Rhabdobacter roseus]MBB5287146.1 site-specific DNA-adenine methylase [Rhabdobacter roseus]
MFWGKPPCQAEVVNDINHWLITSYKGLKYDLEELAAKVDETFRSRAQQKEITNPAACAWSVWVQANLCFDVLKVT